VRLVTYTTMEPERPKVMWVSFVHGKKPYCARIEIDDPDVYEDIEDGLAKGWDACWAKVKEAGEE